jgi:hypothetical protein
MRIACLPARSAPSSERNTFRDLFDKIMALSVATLCSALTSLIVVDASTTVEDALRQLLASLPQTSLSKRVVDEAAPKLDDKSMLWNTFILYPIYFGTIAQQLFVDLDEYLEEQRRVPPSKTPGIVQHTFY